MKKRIFAVFISILMVIPFVLSTPRADDPLTPVTKDYVITSYGNYKVEASTVPSGSTLTTGNLDIIGVEFSMPVGSGGCSVMFNYIFESERSGTMRLNVTLPLSVTLKSCSFAVAGGRFTNMTNLTTQGTSKIFDIKFQDTKAVSFTLFLPTNNTNFDAIAHPITLSNVSIQDGVGLFDIDDTLDQIDHTLDLYIPGMSSNLSNIYSSLGYTQSNTLQSDIALIRSYLDGLEGYTDQIEPYLNQLVNLSKIQSFPIWQQNVLFWANKMGNLQFDRQAPYFYYDSSLNIDGPSNPKRIKIDPNKTVSLIFYCDVNVTNSNYHIYGSQVNNVSATRTISSIVPTYPLYLIRLDFTSSHTSSVFISIEFDNSFNLYPLFLGDSTLIPDDIHILFGDDYNNTYTRLLQQISNGINGTYDTSQYDQYEQTMDGLNDSLRDRFNNVDDNMQNNIDTLFTPSGTAGSDGSIFEKFNFNGVNSLFTGILNGIFTSFPAFKYILLFALLLLVIGVMI